LLVASDTVAVFERPDSESKKWDVLSPNESVLIVGKTPTGWLGFDPGDPALGNLSALSIRWIPPGENYVLQGDSSSLSEIWYPQIHFVYAVTLMETSLHELPKENSDEILKLSVGTVAVIVQLDRNWFEIDLSEGYSDSEDIGWVKAGDCELFGDMSLVPTEDMLSNGEPELPSE